MLDNRIEEKAVLAMKTAYRKSELVAAVITIQSCSTTSMPAVVEFSTLNI